MRYKNGQWEYNEVVQSDDMNRIEENIKELDNQGLKAGADLSDARVNEVRTIEEVFPVPEQGETIKNIIGKIRKFFLDFKALKGNLATKDDLADGLRNKADLNGPVFIGNPRVPTPAEDSNSTSIASTSFVKKVLDQKANAYSPTFTGIPTAPTPAQADNSERLATTGFVQTLLAQNKSLGYLKAGPSSFNGAVSVTTKLNFSTPGLNHNFGLIPDITYYAYTSDHVWRNNTAEYVHVMGWAFITFDSYNQTATGYRHLNIMSGAVMHEQPTGAEHLYLPQFYSSSSASCYVPFMLCLRPGGYVCFQYSGKNDDRGNIQLQMVSF